MSNRVSDAHAFLHILPFARERHLSVARIIAFRERDYQLSRVIVHATCRVAAQVAEVFRVEKRKSPMPAPAEALTLPLKVKLTDPDI